MQNPEVDLRAGEALVGGEPIPAHDLGVVLRDARTLRKHDAEGELCIRVALLS